MKPHKSAVLPVLSVLLVMLLLAATTARAQAVTPSPQLQSLQQERQRLQNMERELERQINLLQRTPPVAAQRSGDERGVRILEQARDILNPTAGGGAWWTNTGLVTRLGLTDDQKARLERAFDAHRPNIVSSTALIEKEEAQLARLLEAEPLVRGAVQAQVDRVIQARGDMERTNAAMTLEMREQLTRAQWMQLQAEPISRQTRTLYFSTPDAAGGPGARGATPPPPAGGAGGRGPRGQQ